MDKMSIEKDSHHESDDDMESTPEAEAQFENPQPKRKGGRKPIYATSEERKQRNRQAQAAFRERRTEYIKQLEDSIRVHEANLQTLQTAHRSAADECLILRYKNSLLERILLEKGIDVQAELHAKTGSPGLGTSHVLPVLAQAPTTQRAMLNRHHQARRINTNIAPKVEPPSPFNQDSASMRRQSTSNQMLSPTTHDPLGQGLEAIAAPAIPMTRAQQLCHGLSRPASGQAFGNPTQRPQRQARSMSAGGIGAPTMSASYYQSPTYRTHIEQLEQGYDASEDVILEEPQLAGPGAYPDTYHDLLQQPHVLRQRTDLLNNTTPHNLQGYAGSLLDPFDPMMDSDPFGLSKSLQFPESAYYENP